MIPSGFALGFLASLICILNFPPLIWHVRNRNTAAACLVGWVFLNNFLSVINLAIWPTNDMATWFSGRGLCDIEAKIIVARSTALPAATFCIIRSLAAVIDTERTMLVPSTVQRRRTVILDLVWCLGIPLITMFLHYIVQPNRYYIFGVSGCNPSVSVDWVTIVILSVPPILLSLTNIYYGGLTLFRLRKYRHSFRTILASSNSTKSRFFRLFAIAATLTLALLPVEIYVLLRDLPVDQFSAHYSWSEIHSKEAWSTIILMPATVLFDRWLDVGVGFLLFALFGCGRDALGMYRSWAVALGVGRVSLGLLQKRCVAGTGASGGSGDSFSSKARLFLRSKINGGGSLAATTSTSTTTATTKAVPSIPAPTGSRPPPPSRNIPSLLPRLLAILHLHRRPRPADAETFSSYPAFRQSGHYSDDGSREQILMDALPPRLPSSYQA